MSEINYQELRERYSPQPVPKCRICGDEMTVQRICGRHITYGCTGATYDDKGCYYAEGRSIADDHYGLSRVTVIDVSDPEVLALLDERERNQQYIKSRDQENEDIALTVGKLLIENGQLVADTLRHLADNEIDSDYFAITSTNENGTEIDHEMAITDYALQAAGTVDELVAALESAEKRIAELESGSQAQKLVEAIIVAIENEQERLFHEDYLMDSKECIDVIREEVKRWNDSRAAGIRIKGE